MVTTIGHELLSKNFRFAQFVLSTLDPDSATSTRFARLVYRLRLSNPFVSRNMQQNRHLRVGFVSCGDERIRTFEGF